jgi:homoaconitase/3-isopropylmalate dehydratase large subunit
MKAMEDDLAARERLGEMLTEYLMLIGHIETGVAAAKAKENAKDAEKYEKAKSNIDKVFIRHCTMRRHGACFE